jgi:hypothetical protein
MPETSPVALRVSLHHAEPVPDHEPAGGLFLDRDLERGAGQFERAADRSVSKLCPFASDSSTLKLKPAASGLVVASGARPRDAARRKRKARVRLLAPAE